MLRRLVWYAVCAAIAIPSGRAFRAGLRVLIERVTDDAPLGSALRVVWVSGVLLLGVLLTVTATFSEGKR